MLLPAVAAERGPDVAIGQAQNMPVNYALRGAVQDLSGFADIDEVLSRFSPAAVTLPGRGCGIRPCRRCTPFR